MENTIVTKAELARELGLHRSTIGHYVKRRMPTRADGKLNRLEALAWIERYVSSLGGGRLQRGKRNTAGLACAALSVDPRITFYESIRDQVSSLPRILLRMNVEPWIVLSAMEAFDMTLGLFVLNVDPDVVTDDQRALLEPDYRALFKSAGIRVNRKQWEEWCRRREDFAEALSKALFPSYPQ